MVNRVRTGRAGGRHSKSPNVEGEYDVWQTVANPPIQLTNRGEGAGDLRADPRFFFSRRMDYPVEKFTAEERARLAPHFTNLDRPVFALVNLPETVKGALFARYSRYQGTLRRLFLDEFADSLPRRRRGRSTAPRASARRSSTSAIFLGYGDDSVAQLGGAHIACEWVSNVLTKVLQRARLAAYLEQSTRYIAYDTPMPAAAATATTATASSGPSTARRWTRSSRSTRRAARSVAEWAASAARAATASPRRRTRAPIQAKALDLLRGLLPAASLSHTSASSPRGQAYEQLLLHLLALPLPEARAVRRDDPRRAAAGDAELRLARRAARSRRRVDRVPRSAREAAAALGRAARPRPRAGEDADGGPSVRLLHVDGDEDELLAACSSRRPARREEVSAAPRRARRATSARELLRRARRRARATAATAPAAASRRSATASRSSPTTAPSATCSATGC